MEVERGNDGSLSSGLPFSNSVINPELFSVANQRTTDIFQPNSDVYRNGRLGGKMTSARNDINSFKEGTSLGRLFGQTASSSSTRDLLRTKNTSPFDDPVLHTTENESNVVYVINMLSIEMSPELGAVGPHQFAILHKRSIESNANVNSLFADGRYVDCTPQEIINPEIFNYVEMLRQEKLYRENYEQYMLESPSDVWASYSFLGIVEAAGKKTARYNGNPEYYGKRMLTIAAKGPQFIINYFGPNIKSGGRLYAIIKRQAVRNDYILDQSKTNLVSNRTHSTYQDKISFRPNQMSFVCIPEGGQLPSEVTRYVDERGTTRRDGLPIFLGHLDHTPPDHVYKNVDPTTVGPYTHLTNYTKSTDILLPKMYFHTDNGHQTI